MLTILGVLFVAYFAWRFLRHLRSPVVASEPPPAATPIVIVTPALHLHLRYHEDGRR
jgi:hypothetical protein